MFYFENLLALFLSVTLFCSSSHAEVTLGLLSELTGSSAANGKACREGYEAARNFYAPGDRIGKLSIRFLFGDHAADGKTAIAEYQRFTKQEGAIAILSTRGNIGMALGPLSRVDKVPLIGMMAHANFTESNPYAFRAWPSPKQEGRALAERAIKSGFKSVAMLLLEDDAVLGIAEEFQKHFSELGGKIVYRDQLTDAAVDYSTLLLKAKQAKPDFLYIHLSVNQIGVAVKRAREIGMNIPIFSYFWIGYPEVLASAGSSQLEGASFASIDTRKKSFLSSLEKVAARQTPSAVTYACYAGLSFVLQTLETFDHEPTKAELYDKLSRANSLVLPDETLLFENREFLFPLKFKVVHQGTSIYQ